MPGHVKLGKAGEPDPDPSPYLVVTLEMKREFALKPYDPKKSYWCPDGKGGYMEGILEDDDGTKAVMMCGHEVIFPITFFYFTLLILRNSIVRGKYNFGRKLPGNFSI